MARARSRGGVRRPTEWFAVFIDETLSTTAATNTLFTEAEVDEKGPFTVLRIIANWSAQGNSEVGTATLFTLAVRKVLLNRASDSADTNIGGTLLDVTYFGSDQILMMVQEHLTPGFSQVDPSSGAVEVSSRPAASGIWDVKAKRKIEDANQRLVVDHEIIGVGTDSSIRLRAAFRVLIQPH